MRRNEHTLAFAIVLLALVLITLWVMRLEDRITHLEDQVRLEQEVRPLP